MLVMSDAPLEDDFAVVDRSGESRDLVGTVGEYTLGSWRNVDGNARLFPCRIVKFSTQSITLDAPISGDIGVWVWTYFKTLGKFEGPVIRKLPRGLVVRIVATHDDRARLDAKIAWHEDTSKLEQRRYQRCVPKEPSSTMWLRELGSLPCQVIDYSVAGAALLAEVTPEIGATIKLGSLTGRVVRHFNGGFALEFLEIQNSADLEQLVVRPPPP